MKEISASMSKKKRKSKIDCCKMTTTGAKSLNTLMSLKNFKTAAKNATINVILAWKLIGPSLFAIQM